MLAFCAFAPMMDALAKATPEHIPVAQIVAFRFAVQVGLLYPLAAALRAPLGFTLREAIFHLARAFTLLLGTYCFFTAIRHMPIADGLAIFFVSPFLVTLLGAVFLGETVGWRRTLASTVGFGGALLVIRPSFVDLGPVALLPLGTALCFALYMLLTRTMSQRAHPLALQAHTALAACALILPALVLGRGLHLPLLDPVWPDGRALVLLFGVGLAATVSHVCLTIALRLAPAGLIASLQYFEIVGGTVIGYLAFGDFPSLLTWVGIAVIVASGLYIIARERRLAQAELRSKAATPPA
jgi:drug/metabolite transporter (DMT)-like permease